MTDCSHRKQVGHIAHTPKDPLCSINPRSEAASFFEKSAIELLQSKEDDKH
jgi:hypothetical protein